MFVLASFAVLIGLCAPIAAFGLTIRHDFYVTDAPVRAALVTGDTLVIGGDFTRVGPGTGGGAAVSATTGRVLPNYPGIVGKVNTVISDGAGGWYVGGVFSSVGGTPRHNLVRILADNSVSPWDPAPDGFEVDALLLNGTTVYVGGDFNTIGGQTRPFLAALDVTTGLATAWNPGASSNVRALAISGSTLYAGGGFQSIGGQLRRYLAALDTGTGLATAWDPSPSNGAYVIALSDTTVYVGGDFNTIGGQTRPFLAALGKVSGLASAWSPNPNNGVRAIVVNAGTLYVGGTFFSIGGQSRNAIAEISTTTGLATAWNPNAAGISIVTVHSLAVSGGTVFAGGDFTSIGGQARRGVAALSATTGLATAWNPNPGSTPLLVAGPVVKTLAIQGGNLFVGGAFTTIGAVTRNHIASIVVSSGVVTPWNPNANISVHALAASGGLIYAGGRFTTIGGQIRSGLAALNAAGSATPWDPQPDAPVHAIALSGATVFAGGEFSFIGGALRNRIAALDAASGLATGWNPSVGGDEVDALLVQGATVYAGGPFFLAALDATTGLATLWDQFTNGNVNCLAVSGATLYAGGSFDYVAGRQLNSLVALDTGSGLTKPWYPDPHGQVNALNTSGATVYVGGTFTNISGQPRARLAALDQSGVLTDWNPTPAGQGFEKVYCFATSGAQVFVGGDFTSIGGQAQSFLAALDAAPPPPLAVPSSGIGEPALAPVSPNPAHGRFSITFSLAEGATGQLELLDLEGRLIERHDLRELAAGAHTLTLAEHAALAPGVYFVRLQSRARLLARRVVVMR